MLCPSLDDSPDDLSGNGNHGTYVNQTATVADSDPTYGGSRAYNFDGTDDYIDIQGLTGQYTIGGSYSTSIWVYQDTVKQQYYFSRYQSEVEVYFNGVTAQQTEWLYAGTTNTRTAAGFNSTVTVGLFPMSFTLANVNTLYANGTNQSGAWYNLVTTYDSTTKTQILYKNGVNVGSTVYGAENNEVLSTDYAEVGRVGAGNYFDGKMDDIRSFTRVLSQAEITLLASTRGFTTGGDTHIHRTLLGVG